MIFYQQVGDVLLYPWWLIAITVYFLYIHLFFHQSNFLSKITQVVDKFFFFFFFVSYDCISVSSFVVLPVVIIYFFSPWDEISIFMSDRPEVLLKNWTCINILCTSRIWVVASCIFMSALSVVLFMRIYPLLSLVAWRHQMFLKRNFYSAVGSAFDCESRGREWDSQSCHITFVGIDYNNIFSGATFTFRWLKKDSCQSLAK